MSILLFGPIDGFENWDRFNVPVKKVNNGFEFLNKYYYGENDGINYISPNSMIYTGNSLLPVWEFQSTPSGLYNYVVVSNSQRILVGNCSPEKPFQTDLISIRNNNHEKINTRDFKIYISKKLIPHLIDENISKIDSIAPEIYRQLKIKPVTEPIICYIHSEPNEATFFANFYFMQGCDELPRDRTFGTVHMKQIHCVGFNTGLIRHEGFHLIWEKSVGLSINEFFIEGIQGFYEWGQDTNIVKRNAAIIRKHNDYDFKKLVLDGDDFWQAPSENGYSIAYPLSGLFVKYLVDNIGLELFKKMYLIEDKNIALRDVYNKSVDEMIADFKDHLQN